MHQGGEIKRYQYHDLYRFNVDDLPQLDFRKLYRPLYDFDRQQVGWVRPEFLWVKGQFLCLASNFYKSPGKEHLQFDRERVLIGLSFQKFRDSTDLDTQTNELRYYSGVLRPMYRDGSIADFVGVPQIHFH